MTNKKKQQYRIRNWRDYNKALVRRGSLTLWIDSRSIKTWLNPDKPAHRDRARLYADVAILCSLLLREVYHLPLRATQGMVYSLLSLLAVDLPVPEVGVPVARVTADGAYDSRECYKAIDKLGARAVIPPRKGSTLWADEYLPGRKAT